MSKPGKWSTGFGLGMRITEHLEVPKNSGIFISNPEYRILFWSNWLGTK